MSEVLHNRFCFKMLHRSLTGITDLQIQTVGILIA